MFRLPALRTLLAFACLPAAAAAQSSMLLDDGTLTITRRGAPIGRESFRIARAPAPGGQIYRATGTTVIEDRRLFTTLGTDSSGMPVSYLATVESKGSVVNELEGRSRPGRFSFRSKTKGGESAREYVLDNGALLMDDEVFHHFYFVPLATSHQRVAVIVPRSAQQSQLGVVARGNEAVEIAGVRIAGRKFTISGADGGSRDVWVDERGRLLKVSIPEKELVALRDDPPK